MTSVHTRDKTSGAANGHIQKETENTEAESAIENGSREPGAKARRKFPPKVSGDDYSVGKDLIPELAYKFNSGSYTIDCDDPLRSIVDGRVASTQRRSALLLAFAKVSNLRRIDRRAHRTPRIAGTRDQRFRRDLLQ